jgi:hypothetical protein
LFRRQPGVFSLNRGGERMNNIRFQTDETRVKSSLSDNICILPAASFSIPPIYHILRKKLSLQLASRSKVSHPGIDENVRV